MQNAQTSVQPTTTRLVRITEDQLREVLARVVNAKPKDGEHVLYPLIDELTLVIYPEVKPEVI